MAAVAESLPFEDQSFDAAMAFSTVHHWQDPIAGLDFSISTYLSTPGSWLTSDAITGTTPRVLTLTADPSNLAPGTYFATITFQSTAGLTLELPAIAMFIVGPPEPARLSVDKLNLSTTFPNGAGARV